MIHYKDSCDGLEHYHTTAACKGISRINGRKTPRLTCTSERARVTCARCLAKLAKLDRLELRRFASKPKVIVYRQVMALVWFVDGGIYETAIEPGACPFCGTMDAVTALPGPLLAVQPDKTTHVCHPALGGCNRGFEKTS